MNPFRFRSLSRLVAVAAAALLPVGVAAPALAQGAAAPKAVLVEDKKDAGTVAKGELIKHAFVLKNTGAADLLITECAYKEGQSLEEWPHLNPETAARIAREAGAKRLCLTHFDAEAYKSLPERKASEALAAGLFPATTASVDGLEIEI